MSDSDPREVPRYALAESAAMLHMSPATLRTWVRGSSRKVPGVAATPLIRLPAPDVLELSFSNVIEALVLRALRTTHGVKMSGIRIALDYVRRHLDIDRLFLREDLLASPGNIFLEQYGRLINLNKAGQHAMRDVLEAHLQRVGYDEEGLPFRFFPLTRGDVAESPRVVVVDPRFSFGRAMTENRGIGTSTIACRFRAGESVKALAGDYGLASAEIEEAIRYEQAIAA